MKTYAIALIPGDGIGKEVIPAGQRVLEALALADNRLSFDFTAFDWGGDYYRAHGRMMPDDGLMTCETKMPFCLGLRGTPISQTTSRSGVCA